MDLLDNPHGSSPPASSKLSYPELGAFAWTAGGWWEQRAAWEGTMVRLAIAGDQSGPDARLARAAVETVVKLRQLRREAIALIAKELPSSETPIDPAAVTITRVCYLRLDEPEEFWLEVGIEGDHDGMWRVEFGPVQELASGQTSVVNVDDEVDSGAG